ncbi:ligase-associated DNA damage response endonuclease PdeM [Oculatella sp. FACHB-28]|uniref:ligase-associated DNA damage response endonuclease PdeM n=1 Tax=Oculatella sp. FACHB-28 TaxID=2692845 RepID=UPI001689F1CB|nr:ligase-associated DNA damage response endonuclease PdeM [Oculatella sp. FACHB-28]MBD2060080.1 ligase-associated DNA damage response endonuclease PdeM [Oculatella sp. FACHB-28]
MKEIDVLGVRLQLLAEKAVYLESDQILLVADIHLGKSETFQSLGIPIPNRVNQTTLDRLQQLCFKFKPQKLFILGDLFHSKYALVNEVLDSWSRFQAAVDAEVVLIVGNHDRRLIQTLKNTSIQYLTHAIEVGNLLLSHEPSPQPRFLNICGHIHPCVNLKEKLDQLRLPCFYLDRTQNLLVLPSFGEFTGAYEVAFKRNSTAYVIADDCVVSLER